MSRDSRRPRPVPAAEQAAYPSYETYLRGRRDVLRWLGAGGTAAAAGGLLGCDPVLDVLGLARPPAQLEGEIACPAPPRPAPDAPPAGDDDSTRPDAQSPGQEPAPQPPEPGAETITEPPPPTRPRGRTAGKVISPRPISGRE